MEIIEFDINNVPTGFNDLALCLGFYDGVHLGHQTIIKEALSQYKNVGVLSFSTPPAFVIGRKDDKRSLTSIDDKADLFDEMGVKYLFIMPFDDKTMNISRLDFIKNVLKVINPTAIFCGSDYRFGQGALGTPKFLSHYFDVHALDLLTINGNKFSSKTIRKLIYEGKIKEANALLGHPYKIGGFVTNGKHIGTGLGFPTANLELDFSYVIPPNGVYLGYAHIFDNHFKCLISIGTHPTLGELDASIIEVYIIDFKEEIYGNTLFIEFIDYLREMKKFDQISDLQAQIRRDVEVARKELI